MESLFALVLIRKNPPESIKSVLLQSSADDHSKKRNSTIVIATQTTQLKTEKKTPPNSIRDVLDNFVVKEGSSMRSMTVKGTAHLYIVLLLAVYQGVCESCAFVLTLDGLGTTAAEDEFPAGSAAASLATFVVIVVMGFVAVWIVLLTYVRPQHLTLFEEHSNAWKGTDPHAVLVQNAGGLFKSYRYGACLLYTSDAADE